MTAPPEAALRDPRPDDRKSVPLENEPGRRAGRPVPPRLIFLQLPALLPSACVVGHPQVDQPRTSPEVPDGGAGALGQADGETTQPRHVFGSVNGADPLAILVPVPVEAAAVFDRPVPMVEREYPCRTGYRSYRPTTSDIAGCCPMLYRLL